MTASLIAAPVAVRPAFAGAEPTTADLGTYREFVVGSTLADVMTRANSTPGDLKTVHERPSLLQELTWRPPYVIGQPSLAQDSVSGILLGFVDGQLYRIAVDYERGRTEGLTNEDMVALLTSRYGAPLARRSVPAVPRPFDSIDAATVLATWRDGDTTVTLSRYPYSSRYGLAIVSARLSGLAKTAQASGERLEAREAPLREAEKVKARAEAARLATEKVRTTNQSTFEP